MDIQGFLNHDDFTASELTAHINEREDAGAITDDLLPTFVERGVSTTDVFLNRETSKASVLTLRTREDMGADKNTRRSRERKGVEIPVIRVEDLLWAKELQNMTPTDSPEELDRVTRVLDQRMEDAQSNIRSTWRYLQWGMMRGKLFSPGDPTNPILDVYDLLDITPETIYLDLANENSDIPDILDRQSVATRKNLYGESMTNQVMVLPEQMFADVIKHKSIVDHFSNEAGKAYLQGATWTNGLQLKNWLIRPMVEVASFTVNGQSNVLKFIEDDEGWTHPNGTRNTYRLWWGPGETFETVNQEGRPYFVNRAADKMNKYVEFEYFSSPLPVCLNPRLQLKVSPDAVPAP